jgi:transposase
VSRHLFRQTALGPVNEVRRSYGSDDLNLSYSLTILTDISSNNLFPIFIDIREESNDQWDFLIFIIEAIKGGFLKAGDYLIMDNAKIHGANESWDILKAILDAAEITLLFLPTYSPELNPCELVFSFLKSDLRLHRQLSKNFTAQLLRSLVKINRAHVIRCYLHCLSNVSFIFFLYFI